MNVVPYRNYIHHTITGGQLTRTLFAHVDKADNFTFTFLPGKSERDIYPGMYNI